MVLSPPTFDDRGDGLVGPKNTRRVSDDNHGSPQGIRLHSLVNIDPAQREVTSRHVRSRRATSGGKGEGGFPGGGGQGRYEGFDSAASLYPGIDTLNTAGVTTRDVMSSQGGFRFQRVQIIALPILLK